eukprot:c28038_g2_i1 orf=799-2133(-)
MLLRSSSTPIVGSSKPCISHRETVREVDFECDSHRHIHKTLPCHRSFLSTEHAHRTHCSHQDEHTGGNWDIEGELISKPGIRRAQSESDLTSLSNGVARNSFTTSLLNSSVEGTKILRGSSSSLHRQWSRRMKRNAIHARSGIISVAVEVRDSILEETDAFGSEREQHEAEDDANSGVGREQFLCSPVIVSGLGENKDTETELSPRKDQDGEYLHSSVHSDGQLSAESSEVLVSVRNARGFLMEDGEVYTSLSVDTNGQPIVCNSKGCRPLSESEKLSPMSIATGLGLCMGGGYSGGTCNSGHHWVLETDSSSTEAYYRKLLLKDPHNPLVLQNFAKFLYEVKQDYKMAEEYYERSILASPSDGDLLSQYAKLIWDVHRDKDRAETYYNQAVQSAPEDCYVLASYASFLWESESKDQGNSLLLNTENMPLPFALQGSASLATLT